MLWLKLRKLSDDTVIQSTRCGSHSSKNWKRFIIRVAKDFPELWLKNKVTTTIKQQKEEDKRLAFSRNKSDIIFTFKLFKQCQRYRFKVVVFFHSECLKIINTNQ